LISNADNFYRKEISGSTEKATERLHILRRGNLEPGFSVDIGIDYQVSNTQSMYNGITENNMKISIEVSLKGQFDSFNLDVAIENREAAGYSKLDISLSLEMLRQSSPGELISGSHGQQNGITPQRVDSLLNLKY